MRRNLKQLSIKKKDNPSIHDYTCRRQRYNIYYKADDNYLKTLYSHRLFKRKLDDYKYAIRGCMCNRCHVIELLRDIVE